MGKILTGLSDDYAREATSMASTDDALSIVQAIISIVYAVQSLHEDLLEMNEKKND